MMRGELAGKPPMGLVVCALRSGEGKTTATLTLARALQKEGYRVHACKCGPDYVDPTFLQRATGAPCHNLDTWLMGDEGVRKEYGRASLGADIVLVEGVMGLLDGHAGECGHPKKGSTLDVARALSLPLLLVVNAKGLGESISLVASSVADMCARVHVPLVGILATNGGSARHRQLLERALDENHLPPLLFFLARDKSLALPSRQLGLVPAGELDELDNFLFRLDAILDNDRARSDTKRLVQLARDLAPLASPSTSPATPVQPCGKKRRLAVARDAAFCFYYEDNFRFLKHMGYELTFFSPMQDMCLPPCDALYLGGGYPEVHAKELCANEGMRTDIRRAAWEGLPILAECGGYMYLAGELVDGKGKSHAMCGVINACARMGTSLASLGYREACLLHGLPLGLKGDIEPVVRGHEFHWSDMVLQEDACPLYVDDRGKKCGIVLGKYHNVQASYLHFYLPSLTLAGKKAQEPQNTAHHGESSRPLLVLVNGPSSSGKSTLVRHLAGSVPEAIAVSLDLLLLAHAQGDPSPSLARASAEGFFAASDYHAHLARLLGRTSILFCDHVLCGRRDWEEDLSTMLARCGADLLALELVADQETIRAREGERRDRPGDEDHALEQWRLQQALPLSLPHVTLDATMSADALAKKALFAVRSRLNHLSHSKGAPWQ